MMLVLCKIFAFSTFWVCLIWTILIRYGEMGNLAPQSKLVKFLRRGRGDKLMASEWTKEELRATEEEIDDSSNMWKPWREVTTEVICQRNRALAALERIYFICSNAGHAPCRCGGIDGEGNVCPNVCNCDWPKEIIPIVDAAIAVCKKGGA